MAGSETEPGIVVDKACGTPIYVQIYESVRDGIVRGDWKPGDKLPSIRALAATLDVARNTIDNAYKQLSVEGYVKSRQGSGYIVQNISRNMLVELARKKAQPKPRVIAEPARKTYRYDFGYGNLCEGVFPMDAWRRIAGNVLSEKNAGKLVAYNDKRGERSLREQIARHVARMRQVSCKPEQVIVTNGTQQSIALILGLFDPAKDVVAMDDPGFDGAHVSIESMGFRVERLRTDGANGTFLSDVRNSDARIFYTTPSHQFPMGWCMDQQTRSQLILHAVMHDAYILEDDYDSGYRYTTRSVPSLQSIDRWGRVIYLGTFSKILSPALRLSYMVLPPALLARYEERYRHSRVTSSWLDQQILAEFMACGQWDKHVRRTTLAYRKRCELVMDTLAETFGGINGCVKVHGGDAGLFVLLEVDNGMDQEELVASAAKQGVHVEETRHYWLDPEDAPDALVMLGFSAIDDEGIRQGIPLLKKAWFPDA